MAEGQVLGAPMFMPDDMFGMETMRHTRSTLSSLRRRVRSERIEAGLRPANVPEATATTARWLHPTKGWRTMGPTRTGVRADV